MRIRYNSQKLYLNQWTVDQLRERFLEKEGKTEEEFDAWLDKNVVIVGPLD